MILDSQKYQNTTRSINGLVNFVFNTDTIIVCDTTLAPVQIQLLEIPSDSWNTTRKFYFVDSGNASANNITITAPAGYTINGQSTLVLNANNQTALIRVGSNTDYLGYTSSGNGSNLSVLNQSVQITPSASSMNFLGLQATAVGNAVTIQNNFISGTYAQIAALAAANSLIPSQAYQITNALYGSLPVKNISVYLIAISTNELSISGSGYFFNADYDNLGVYSGVPGYTGQLGIWSLTLLPVIGNVCIWNNLHYVNTTGSNGLNNPSLDPINWSVLAYTNTNGYIVEVDTIKYDFSNNRIIERQDFRLNSVSWCNTFVGYDSFNHFRWGDNKCSLNSLFDSVLYNCNNVLYSIKNVLNESLVVIGTSTAGGSTEMSENEFISSSVLIPIQANIVTESFTLNRIEFSQLTFVKNDLTSPGSFVRNIVSQSSITLVTFEGTFTYNIFENASSTLINQVRTGVIGYNRIENSTFIIIDNSNSILYNQVINGSDFRVSLNTGLISNNLIQFSSIFNIGTNSSNIENNQLNSFSQLNLNNNANLYLNNYIFDSQITCVVIQNGRFIGNTFNNSFLTINTSNANISDNSFKNTAITIVNLTVAISENQVNNGTLNINSLSVAIDGGIYIDGIATTKYVLDLNDPSIFNAGTLTIPNSIASFFGVYTLQNCAGQNITKIVNPNSDVPIRFLPDANTIILTRTAVGAAVANDIIASAAVVNWTLTYRINGNDSIQLRRLGNLNGVIETEIYV